MQQSIDRINEAQRLYVFRASGGGYSCLGFDVAERRGRAVAAWCGAAPPVATPGTEEHLAEYEAIMSEGRAYAQKTGLRCPAELDPQLDSLYGERVEVVDKYGGSRRFYVGRSTGWLPCNLEIAQRNSSGGPGVCGAPFQSVTRVGKRR